MKKGQLVFLLVFIVFGVQSVMAAHVITFSDGTTSTTILEDTNVLFNISINNTDLGLDSNISEVNFTLPGSFTYAADSNGTDSGTHTFNQTASVLSWSNDGLVMNQTRNYFWFNISDSGPGNSNISVSTRNSSTTFYFNLSIVSNDTTAPSAIDFVSPSEGDGANVSGNIDVNISAADNQVVDSVSVRIFNSTNGLINTTIFTAEPYGMSFTGLSDGYYSFNATVNDTFNNVNNSGTRTIQLDSTYPLISFGNGALGDGVNQTSTSIYINISGTESNEGNITFELYNGTGIENSTTYTDGSRTINWTASLSDATYSFNVTLIDYAGNTNTTATRTVIIDNTNPLIDFGMGTQSDGASVFVQYIYVNVSVTELYEANITFNLYNSSSLVNSSVFSDGTRVINWTGLDDGNYSYNVSVVDFVSQSNYTSTRSVLLTNPSTFEFNGTVSDLDGNALNNSVINFTIYNSTNTGFSVIGYEFTTTNETGWFNLSVTGAESGENYLYGLSVTHVNETHGHVDFVGQSLPYFPSEMFEQAAGVNFYLREAGTMNITAVNSSGDRIYFEYQVKDKKLGYAIAESFSTGLKVDEVELIVPIDRNYSIMIYPNESMPGSADFSNFTSSQSYGQGTLAAFNHTTNTITKTLNMTMGWSRVYGYVNLSGEGFSHAGFDELTVLAYLLEPGDMTQVTYGMLPYNLSWFFEGNGDIYDVSTGYYNISLPSTVEDSEMILFATARNGSGYYGGFNNLSISYSAYPSGGYQEINFTHMFGMLGEPTNLTPTNLGDAPVNVSAKMQTFNLVNETNGTLTNVFAHIEATVDYSEYGVKEFTWMADVEQGSSSANLDIPLINVTGFKEMNVYASGGSTEYAPKRVSLSVAEILINNNITMGEFDPEFIGEGSNNISIGLIISNATCDVPSPDSECFPDGGAEDEGMFNPLKSIIGGGRVSFLMGTDDVKVQYANVDMLASGPPDALFEDEENVDDEGGSGFEAAMRFGSGGPTIFDYALVGMRYDDSTGGSGLNDSEDVNMSINLFYNDDFSALLWNVTANGSSGEGLGGNFSHYSDRSGEWEVLMNGTTCHDNRLSINVSYPCFINTSSNAIWVRVPHFSGWDVQISGAVLASAPGGSGSSSSGGGGSSSSSGGGGGTPIFWQRSKLFYQEEELAKIGVFKEDYVVKERALFLHNGDSHSMGVASISEGKVTVRIESEIQEAVLGVGESARFDLDGSDGYYDLRVTLISVDLDSATLESRFIYEEIPEVVSEKQESVQESGSGTGDVGTSASPGTGTGNKKLLLGFLVFIVLAIGVLFFVLRSIDKHKRIHGLKIF